jgi:hypothetical protein
VFFWRCHEDELGHGVGTQAGDEFCDYFSYTVVKLITTI